jgi:hypothetical protein
MMRQLNDELAEQNDATMFVTGSFRELLTAGP